MATTFTLKRKVFALLAGGGGKSISQFKAEFDAFKAQNPGSNQSFTEWYNGKNRDVVKMQASATERMKGVGGSATANTAYGAAGSNSAIGQANQAINTADATRTATRNTIKSNPNLQNRMAEVGKTSRQAGYNAGKTAGYNAGMTAGKNSATLNKQVMKNTWNKLGTGGKVGVAAGAVALGGLAVKGLVGNKKEKSYSFRRVTQ